MNAPPSSANDELHLHHSTPTMPDRRRAMQAEIDNRKEIKSAIAVLSANMEKISSKVHSLES